MAPAIPDRWENYKPVGQKIEGTRFIAFKVPLREHISKTVDSDIRLDGRILLESIPNLGLIIDLTSTTRYYDPNFFIKMGVGYEKLMIPGHITPHKSLVDQFVRLVKKFLENNPDNDKLIGVHCTHGVNRTGYLICNYMISEMTIEPNEAMRRFADARGHKIERINYINGLLGSNNLTRNKKSPTISNWRERKPITAAEPRNWRDTKKVDVKFEDLRLNIDSRRRSPDRHRGISNSRSSESYRRDRYRDSNSRSRSRRSPNSHRRSSISKSPSAYGRDRYDGSSRSRSNRRSPNRYRRTPSRSKSPRSPKTYSRDRHGSNRRSPIRYNSSNSRSYRTSHNTESSDRYAGNNSFKHLPEDVTNRSSRPAVRTDYNSSRQMNGDNQRSIDLQRFKYVRNRDRS